MPSDPVKKIRDMLADVYFLEGVDQRDLGRLAKLSSLYQNEQPHTVFEQGSAARSFYILLDGQVEIRFQPEDGGNPLITLIEPQGIFGWSAAIGRAHYTSSAVAITPIRAIRTEGRLLRDLYGDHPDTGEIILRRLAGAIAGRIDITQASVMELLMSGIMANRMARENGAIGGQ